MFSIAASVLLTYNCTLEDVASITASFGSHNEYAKLYGEIPNLKQTVYEERNPYGRPVNDDPRLKGLDITAFIGKATKKWTDEFKQMGHKTQFACYLDGGYSFKLVCAFA
ncbi:hypothetical protein Aduo_000527 [Ancylostoma duodenale]